MDVTKVDPGIWLIAASILLFIMVLPGGVTTLNNLIPGRKRIDISKWTTLTTVVFAAIALLLLVSGLLILFLNTSAVKSLVPAATPVISPSETPVTKPTVALVSPVVLIAPSTPTITANNCESSIRAVIDAANLAQIGVIKQILPVDALSSTWGEMAFRASYKADRLLADKRLVSISEVHYTYVSFNCHASQDLPGEIIVETDETWEYDAVLNCPDSATPRDSVRVDTYHERYDLIPKGTGWQIHDWRMSRQEKTEPWCE